MIQDLPFDREADDAAMERIQPLRVALLTLGNPDLGQDPGLPLPGIANRLAAVTSLHEARWCVRAFIDAHALGTGNWVGGQVLDSGDHQVAYVSYNGRVWLPGGARCSVCRRGRRQPAPSATPTRALRPVSP